MKVAVKDVIPFAKEVFKRFTQHEVFNLGASLAYYTVFSIAPVLIIVIAAAGVIFGPEAMRHEVYEQLRDLLGREGAQQVEALIENSYQSKSTFLASVISIATLLFAATTVFYQLKNSLNKIWYVRATPKNGLVKLALDRALSFTVVLAIGFVLLILQVINAVVAVLGNFLSSQLPEVTYYLIEVLNFVIALGLTAFLFGLMFKYLPDAKTHWRDLWPGAIFTALLFMLGRTLIRFYISQSNFSDTFGAAGAIIILLVWVYYNAQILFLGAEFTVVYVERYGAGHTPSDNAVRIVPQPELVEEDEPVTE